MRSCWTPPLPSAAAPASVRPAQARPERTDGTCDDQVRRLDKTTLWPTHRIRSFLASPIQRSPGRICE
ncbi:MAG: hypothetical protein JWQ03_1735 [Variovorax sp.]|nr:hypothetical protein [Variovorax sp.]